MRSKTFIKPDGAAEMQQISIEICGKGGATGIKAVTQLANMVNEFIDKKSADDLMCLAAYLAGNEQDRAEAQQRAERAGKGRA